MSPTQLPAGQQEMSADERMELLLQEHEQKMKQRKPVVPNLNLGVNLSNPNGSASSQGIIHAEPSGPNGHASSSAAAASAAALPNAMNGENVEMVRQSNPNGCASDSNQQNVSSNIFDLTITAYVPEKQPQQVCL